MTIERTQAGHQTRYMLRHDGTVSCMLTCGTAELALDVWKIQLPGPGGAEAIYGEEQFPTPDAGLLQTWLATLVGDDRAAELTGAVNAEPPVTSDWARHGSRGS